ncbi:MAG: hypothetical protein ACI9I8_000079 [Cellvibrionaceae bacterium]|jgi:hypothetical protein
MPDSRLILRIISLYVLLLATRSLLMGQDLDQTYYRDIQPIIYQNCVQCHQPGQSGPFSLLTYEDLANRSNMIQYVIKNRYMPPWYADPTYQNYLNERGLTDKEIESIVDWIKSGKVAGIPVDTLEIPDGLIPNKSPDLRVEMNNVYQIPAKGIDDFRFFHMPTNIEEDKYLQAIEFIPGNSRYVHHSRIMADTTNNIEGIDGLSEMDPSVYDFQKVPLADDFLYGWVPGNFPLFFPDGVGKKLYANTDLVLNIHYAPSSSIQSDRSAIQLYFSKKKVKREVQTMILRENDIVNQPFFLPADQKPTFFIQSDTIESDISLISVMPHMHYLGKSFESYAVTLASDTIPLIRIPKWDFNWQTMYQFEGYLKIPAGSVIYAIAAYDNTVNNPLNQYFPPRNVTYGWRTVDEMMNLVFYYLDYKKGDEKVKFKK